ncbi:DUF3857 domain-containing transglutaminase family protein [Marinomonas mediterranea]|uniref:DUF3857 domain-containing transglutaminase family protein n=1 Tax=Marinomonas mediterranea TaxID=119864 RepID=UPI00234A86EA|nr:DUF3857 domain-containing protein [Marinomonas mediterranea]WCN07455.1 DUF3857 domain-containing protein [Marinomonas mediterranea]
MIWKGLKPILLCASLLASFLVSAEKYQSNGFQFETKDFPSWVTPKHLPDLLPTQHQGSVSYLLLDRQEVADGNDSGYFYHLVQRANNLDGVEDISKLSISFNPEYQKLVFHNISVIRDGQEMNRLEPSDISLVREENELSQELFTGYVDGIVFLKDIRVGDIVDYSYSIEGRNPVFQGHFFSSWSMNWQVPVNYSYLKVITTPDYPLTIKNTGYKSAPLITDNGSQLVYEWTAENTPTYYYEDNYPRRFSPRQTVSLSEFDSWEKVNAWGETLYSYDFTNEELNQFVASLSKKSKSDAVLAALDFVQEEIRYLGIELGLNSHLPHSPDEVIQHRYGDCKDKTQLLVSLLKKLNITAYPALVSWDKGSGVDLYAPSPGVFDHVITYVELDGQAYWLDPTRSFQEGTLETLGYYDYGKALILGHPEKKSLVTVGLKDSQIPVVETRDRFSVLSTEAPVEYTVITTYTGTRADQMRRRVATSRLEALESDYINYLSGFFPGIEKTQDMIFKDHKAKNQFDVEEHYLIHDFFSEEDGRKYYTLYAYGLYGYIKKPEVTRRKGPLWLQGPVKLSHQIDYVTPNKGAMNIDSKRVEKTTDQLWFMKEEDWFNRTLTIRHELMIKSDELQAKDMKSYLKFYEMINDNTEHAYWAAEQQADNGIFADFISDLQQLIYTKEGS